MDKINNIMKMLEKMPGKYQAEEFSDYFGEKYFIISYTKPNFNRPSLEFKIVDDILYLHNELYPMFNGSKATHVPIKSNVHLGTVSASNIVSTVQIYITIGKGVDKHNPMLKNILTNSYFLYSNI